jgi:hypothetical protein
MGDVEAKGHESAQRKNLEGRVKDSIQWAEKTLKMATATQ